MATCLRISISMVCTMGFMLAACSSSKNTADNNQGLEGGGAGGAGSVKLEDCDQHGESSAHPVTQACGTFTTSPGTHLTLGQYGAMMDVNVGAGFENVDPMDDTKCVGDATTPGFLNLFKEDPAQTAQIADTGPQPCNATAPNTGDCLDYKLYSVYRPAIWPSGKIPVLSWGNGTCAQPEGYGGLLRYIASHGFFVVASNSREVLTGVEQLHALDYVASANGDPKSPYYGHLDLSKVGVMGHSQGSASTIAAAKDSRVTAAILFNAGDTAVKPYLAISGDKDVTNYTAQIMATAIAAAPKAGYLYYHNPAGTAADPFPGHLVLMLTPDRVADAAVGFWQLILNNDAKAHDLFIGASCGLCGHSADYDYGENGL
jgi:hypothetical protein